VVRHALPTWRGGERVGFAGTVRKQQHCGVERRKEKKTRNLEQGRAASKLRTSEKPARAGEGSTQTPGPTLPPPPPVSVSRNAPSEAIAMQHGGCSRRSGSSSCSCGGRRYCYCWLLTNGTAADSVEIVVHDSHVVVHSRKSTMMAHRQRRRPGFTAAATTTTTAPSSSSRQMII